MTRTMALFTSASGTPSAIATTQRQTKINLCIICTVLAMSRNWRMCMAYLVMWDNRSDGTPFPNCLAGEVRSMGAPFRMLDIIVQLVASESSFRFLRLLHHSVAVGVSDMSRVAFPTHWAASPSSIEGSS
ncbi:hypothetical protein PV11_00027 [Exophiala sideris]|uniref:Uncharacterized protein n=1 Tax=Exophiala sideris TaxID=1016849 RepID=A0A0D1X8T7_9EURO|nr:hypothetical protein PV11_00027 [Exophiala sideris]